MNQEECGEFFNVLWDAPHFIDLAFTDVFNGKTGDSKDFIKTLVERSSVVYRLFQHGKMLSHAVEMSVEMYIEFCKLLDTLPLYIKVFREYKYSGIKEFQIAGQDFLMDLCGFCDILRRYMKMFVALQGLRVPCWKVVVVEKADEHLFNTIGIEGCVTIDNSLAKGGTEAVVESYYSVMNSQKMSGGQQNETLAGR